MAQRVFIGIGVARPLGMAALPGVSNSIGQMVKWAEREGYNIVKAITDNVDAVTAPRIAEQMRPILEKDIDRIVVYFVGHGFLNSPDQIWILSDGPDVNTGRISRDALRASISTYRPRQISMIADACLEARHFQSGTVPVLYDAPGPRRRVFVDNIFSTLPNDPSFFFHSKDAASEFCLFTSVLANFLNGEDERAFRLANGVIPTVTTQTLYWNLPDAVLECGAGHGVNQEPRVEPGFPQGDDVYSSFAKPGVPIGPYPPSDDEHTSQPPEGGGPFGTGARRNLRDSIPFDERTTSSRDPIPPLLDDMQIERLKAEAFHRNERLTALIHREGPKASRGIIINEASTEFFTAPIQGPDDRSVWYPILVSNLDRVIPCERRKLGSVLSISWSTRKEEEGAEFFVILPIFDSLIATVHLIEDGNNGIDGGCKQIYWSPDYTPHLYSPKTTTAWRALTSLTNGKLVTADAMTISDGLRDEKHLNPMIGIVCAYLYDLAGDLDSISRLCHFYVEHYQGIPFDIALLSGAEFRRAENHAGWEVSYAEAKEDTRRAPSKGPDYLWRSTPKGVGRVAGTTPLVRAGWSRLATHEDTTLRQFGDLADNLTNSPIATLIGGQARDRATVILRQLGML